MSNSRVVPVSLLAIAVFVATAFNGATEHLPAFLLRTAVLVAVFLVWPRRPVSLYLRDLVPPAAALLLVVAALPWAASFGPAVQATLKVAFVVLVFLAARTNPGVARVGLAIATAVGIGHAIWALVERPTVTRATGGFFSPNDLAAFLAPLLVLALIRASSGDRTTLPIGRFQLSMRATAAGAALLLGAGLIASGSRSGLLAALVACAALLFGRARRPALFGALALVMVVLVVPSLRDRFTGADDPHAFARINIWQRAAQVALREPLGVGLGGFGTAMRREGVPVAGHVRYPKRADNAHSELIYAWVELGWLGVGVILLAAGRILLVLWRRRATALGDVAMFASFAIPAAVSTSLHLPPVAYLAALWAGQLTAEDERTGVAVAVRRGRLGLGLLGGALLLLAVPGLIASTSLTRSAALRDSGDIKGALAHARRAARFEPWSLGAALMVESLRHASGEPPLEIAERLLVLAQLHPQNVEPLERAAVLLEGEARASEEIALWMLAGEARAHQAERDPHNALAWVALGRIHLRLGEREQATAAFERATAVEPECASALAHLAAEAHARGDEAAARKLAHSARASDGLAPSFHDHARRILSLDPISRTLLEQLER